MSWQSEDSERSMTAIWMMGLKTERSIVLQDTRKQVGWLTRVIKGLKIKKRGGGLNSVVLPGDIPSS